MTLATLRESRLMKQCAKKRRFYTLREADQMLSGVRKHDVERHIEERSEGLRVYWCRFCGGWHLGHVKQGKEIT